MSDDYMESVAWLYSQTTLTSTELLVLRYLVDFRYRYNEKGIPSQKLIAENTKISTRTVLRALQSLEKKNKLSREKTVSKKGYPKTNYFLLDKNLNHL